LHENGIAHRDIKLENVMVDDKENAVLIDFEYAKLIFGNDQNGNKLNG